MLVVHSAKPNKGSTANDEVGAEYSAILAEELKAKRKRTGFAKFCRAARGASTRADGSAAFGRVGHRIGTECYYRC